MNPWNESNALISLERIGFYSHANVATLTAKRLASSTQGRGTIATSHPKLLMRSRHLDLDKACTRWSRGRGQRCGPSLCSPAKGIEYMATRYAMAICSSRKHRRRRCRGWAGWAHSGRLAAQGARHGTVSMCCRLFLLFAVTRSPNAVDPAVLEPVEAAAGSSHKGRFHARLAAADSPSARHSQVPRREAIAYHITGALLVDAWHMAWHGMARVRPTTGDQPIPRNRRRLRFLACPSSGDRDSLGSLSEQRESRQYRRDFVK